MAKPSLFARPSPGHGKPRKPPRPASGRCQLCGRPRPLSFHHLIPRELHDKRWARLRFGPAEMQVRGAWLCRLCHRFLHAHFDAVQLGRDLNTLASLRAEPSIARHVGWARRQR